MIGLDRVEGEARALRGGVGEVQERCESFLVFWNCNVKYF